MKERNTMTDMNQANAAHEASKAALAVAQAAFDAAKAVLVAAAAARDAAEVAYLKAFNAELSATEAAEAAQDRATEKNRSIAY